MQDRGAQTVPIAEIWAVRNLLCLCSSHTPRTVVANASYRVRGHGASDRNSLIDGKPDCCGAILFVNLANKTLTPNIVKAKSHITAIQVIPIRT